MDLERINTVEAITSEQAVDSELVIDGEQPMDSEQILDGEQEETKPVDLVVADKVKAWWCYVCNRTFRAAGLLRRHNMKHTGERPHKCSVCSRGFTRTDELRRHQRAKTPCVRDNKFGSEFDDAAKLSNESNVDDMAKQFQGSIDGDDVVVECGWSSEEDHMTKPSEQSGVVARMSPEQSEGENKLVQSIIWSNENDDTVKMFAQAIGCNNTEEPLERSGGYDKSARPRSRSNRDDNTKEVDTNLQMTSLTNDTAKWRWRCSTCGRDFAAVPLLRRHQRIHTGEQPYKCSVCRKAFSRVDELRRHERGKSHPGENRENEPNVCHVCGRQFKSIGLLDRHVRTHEAELSWSYNNSADLQSTVWQCNVCGQDFADKLLLTHHKRIHTDMWPYKCMVCDRAFTRIELLRAHLQGGAHRVKNRAKDLNECVVCGLRFQRLIILERHMRLHADEGSWSCRACDKWFSALGLLDVHWRSVHAGDPSEASRRPSIDTERKTPDTADERPYGCAHCGKRFLTIRTLQRHSVTHSDKLPFICMVCGKRLSRSSYLKKHMLTQHSDERPYVCDVCGRDFALRERHADHMMTHATERPYMCHVCGKQFVSTRRLLKHEHSHTGVRPYECAICGQAYVRRIDLRRHMFVHTGGTAPKHMCMTCGGEFSNMSQHRMTHTGERHYKCNICEKGFRSNFFVARHIQSVHQSVKRKLKVCCDDRRLAVKRYQTLPIVDEISGVVS